MWIDIKTVQEKKNNKEEEAKTSKFLYRKLFNASK